METLTPGCLGFRFGKKGPRKPGRLFCWESWGGLGKELPFFSLTQSLSWAHCPGGGGRRGAALTGKWLARNFQSCCPNCLTRALSCSSCQNREDRGLSYTCAEKSCS